MITAVDARELQKHGVPQSEYYSNACDRAEAAIIDTARKGKHFVDVALFYLDEKSTVQLREMLTKCGFTLGETKKINPTTISIKIEWNNPT
jgi:hypothetical protein